MRILRCGGYEQVGHLSAMLAAAREHSLNLASPLNMTRVGLDQAKCRQGGLKRIPLAGISG